MAKDNNTSGAIICNWLLMMMMMMMLWLQKLNEDDSEALKNSKIIPYQCIENKKCLLLEQYFYYKISIDRFKSFPNNKIPNRIFIIAFHSINILVL